MACGFSYKEDVLSYRVKIVKGATDNQLIDEPSSLPLAPVNKEGASRGSVALISSELMGRGDEALGRLLMQGFIFSLSQLNLLPETLIFLNSGVYLTKEGSKALHDIKILEEKGTNIYICGACVDFYGLKQSIGAGNIVDMMFITEQLAKAANVIAI
jgi:selenium metabolism protein YedF